MPEVLLGIAGGFVAGWILGRKEFAYWLVRHPKWKRHIDGEADGDL